MITLITTVTLHLPVPETLRAEDCLRLCKFAATQGDYHLLPALFTDNPPLLQRYFTNCLPVSLELDQIMTDFFKLHKSGLLM